MDKLRKADAPGRRWGIEEARIEVRKGQVARHDFGVTGVLRGKVLRDGEPATGARLAAWEIPSGDSYNSQDMSALSAIAGEDGGYRLTGMKAGTWNVTVTWHH